MSFREHASNVMDNLIASGIWSAAIVLAVKFWPWIVATFSALRVALSSLPATLLRRLRALLPTRPPVLIVPGTASLAIATAVPPGPQGPPMQPQFVNNSQWMQWQAARAAHHHSETGMLMAMQAHEQELERARFAMRSTMPKYNHALTP
jgi:hypothetical protein